MVMPPFYFDRTPREVNYPEGAAWLSAITQLLSSGIGEYTDWQERKRQTGLDEQRMSLLRAAEDRAGATADIEAEKHEAWKREQGLLHATEDLPGAVPSGGPLQSRSLWEQKEELPLWEAERGADYRESMLGLERDRLTETERHNKRVEALTGQRQDDTQGLTREYIAALEDAKVAIGEYRNMNFRYGESSDVADVAQLDNARDARDMALRHLESTIGMPYTLSIEPRESRMLDPNAAPEEREAAYWEAFNDSGMNRDGQAYLNTFIKPKIDRMTGSISVDDLGTPKATPHYGAPSIGPYGGVGDDLATIPKALDSFLDFLTITPKEQELGQHIWQWSDEDEIEEKLRALNRTAYPDTGRIY